MIERLGAVLTRLVRRWMPDPFVFALALTLLTALAAVALAGATLADLAAAWRPANPGFWGLLEFSMQMCLVLVGGHAIATAPPVRRALRALARRRLTSGSAAALVAFCALAAGLVNWGLGLLAGAFLAREIGRTARREGRRIHYPLVAAAGYSGLLIWHGGLSGSAPLDAAARAQDPIPLSQTLALPMNLILNAALLVVVPIVYWAMAPRRDDAVAEADLPDDPAEPPDPTRSPARWMEETRLWTILFGAAAAYVAIEGVLLQGAAFFNLYTVTFLFLFLGWILHGRPMSFVRAVSDAAKGCGGIILQFPFYAGIAAILAGTGLQRVLVDGTIAATRAAESIGVPAAVGFPVLTFLAACVINLFIPSGGGQWKVQGPVVMEAGAGLGVPPGKTVMMVAYGDELTNMVQPFWALALLGVTGLRARDIMGYTAATMLIVTPIYLLCIAFL